MNGETRSDHRALGQDMGVGLHARQKTYLAPLDRLDAYANSDAF